MKIGIVGATGLVGRKTLEVLGESGINADYFLFASKNSVGKKLEICGKICKVRELSKENIDSEKMDYVLFCAGASVAKKFVPLFIASGAIVIDFSSEYRNTDAPLVVPEVNGRTFKKNKLICNPNCSTIGAAVFLAGIHRDFGLEKVIVSTYQAVSGAGKNALSDLENKNSPLKKFDYPIHDNTLCYIGTKEENGYTTEEMKMVNELRKIFDDENIKVCSTCVRVPVTVCHGESIWLKTKKKCTLSDIKDTLKCTENVILFDDYPHYPMPIECRGQDKVFVGRLRPDLDDENAFSAFIVSDNLRKGASSNGVQILKLVIEGESL